MTNWNEPTQPADLPRTAQEWAYWLAGAILFGIVVGIIIFAWLAL